MPVKPNPRRWRHWLAILTPAAAFCFAGAARASAPGDPEAPVVVTETADSYVLANGRVAATVDKHSGGLTSLRYKGNEVLARNPRHPPGYWSHTPGPRVIDAVTLDPAKNNGDRGEVSVKGDGDAVRDGLGGGVDVELRYALSRGASGLYAYSILRHPADHPASSIGEARFCAKLNDAVFDWITVDARRNRLAITAYDWDHGTELNMKEARRMTSGVYKGEVEHKYDYAAVQFDTPAFGWSSTRQHIGLWLINPTIEYLSGGATKVELCAHRDSTFEAGVTGAAPPCVLNYWRGSHYGGTSCEIGAGENWTKVIGPFLIYCNSGSTPDAMWKDALSAATREAAAWPYDWVAGVDYPHKAQRGTVTGQIVVRDPLAPPGAERMSNVLVGLAAPDYTVPGRRGPSVVDWQLDAKYYQFWARAGRDGHFTIPNVRPGVYTLHAIADGILGEYVRANVRIGPGEAADLGRLDWKPVRHGRQLWEIGVPDRTAGEFLHGDHYWQWGLYLQYPQDFPDDVNFVIGKSNPRKDWNYCQCPRPDRPRGTPWTVTFDLPGPPAEAPTGKATLRLALAAASARRVSVSVNGQPAGDTGPLRDTATIRRDGIRGYWVERDVAFDASLLKPGVNHMTLTIPSGNPMAGVEYDYLRLELDATQAR